MDLNRAMVIGRLTRDPEGRATPQGNTVANFSVATNFTWVDQNSQRQEKVEYHNIVAWRKLADICNQYLRKGSKVYIEGRLQTRDWEGQDGVKRYRTEIVADNMIMLDRVDSSAPKTANQPPAPQPVSAPVEMAGTELPSAPASETSDDDIKIENIPF
ncbi:single-stranded DNA-binding protein [Candidatus Falkowbacteria bacterium]|nr:single-stranded DNA-binding protein [Candidatus Falkowbacteria bacterium]